MSRYEQLRDAYGGNWAVSTRTARWWTYDVEAQDVLAGMRVGA